MSTAKERIRGYDLARTVAIFGMVLINFREIFDAQNQGPAWLMDIMDFTRGRAAVIFVTLAGVGLSLMARHALLSHDKRQLRRIRISLLKRSFFLFSAGVLFSQIWGADILRFYSVFLLIGTLLITLGNRWLIGLGFTTALFSMDVFLPTQFYVFTSHAIWYKAFITYIIDTVDEIFIDGSYTVFPWLGFLIMGMWVGRQDFSNPVKRMKILFTSLFLFGFLEVSARQLSKLIEGRGYASDETIFYTFIHAEAFPASTLFVFSAGAVALMVISLCMWIRPRLFESELVKALTATGQLSLTIYIVHILIGYSILQMWKSHSSADIDAGLWVFICGLLFCIAVTPMAYVWCRHFQRGPLEGIMRRLTG